MSATGVLTQSSNHLEDFDIRRVLQSPRSFRLDQVGGGRRNNTGLRTMPVIVKPPGTLARQISLRKSIIRQAPMGATVAITTDSIQHRGGSLTASVSVPPQTIGARASASDSRAFASKINCVVSRPIELRGIDRHANGFQFAPLPMIHRRDDHQPACPFRTSPVRECWSAPLRSRCPRQSIAGTDCRQSRRRAHSRALVHRAKWSACHTRSLTV